jgi:predicted metal-dependent phosphoesterase TrpH
MSEYFCDLHTHSTASDGSDTPSELVKKAMAAGLKAVALTDHDTVAGIEEAMAEAKQSGMELVPGVELSVIHEKGNMHMLCYLMDHTDKKFNATLEKLQQARGRRNERMLELLAKNGRPVTMEELRELAGDGQVGRPHFARAMVKRGYVTSVAEAFERFLKRGEPAYVPKSILTAEDAIKVIHGAGGVAVLAHPCSLKTSSLQELESIISGLAQHGLDGVECYYSEHGRNFTEKCIELAKRYDLIITGGSDYHGKAKPHIAIGKGKGKLHVPYSCVTSIMQRKEKAGY